MNIDYPKIKGEKIAVISGIEETKGNADKWDDFFEFVNKRYENMMPTITLSSVSWKELEAYIAKCANAVVASAIVGRLLIMGYRLVDIKEAVVTVEASSIPKKKEKKPRATQDYTVSDFVYHDHKPVQQLDADGNVINEFASAREASERYNINVDSLRQCCRGKIKTSGGRLWRYKPASCAV